VFIQEDTEEKHLASRVVIHFPLPCNDLSWNGSSCQLSHGCHVCHALLPRWEPLQEKYRVSHNKVWPISPLFLKGDHRSAVAAKYIQRPRCPTPLSQVSGAPGTASTSSFQEINSEGQEL
jgi:hypothetical protein